MARRHKPEDGRYKNISNQDLLDLNSPIYFGGPTTTKKIMAGIIMLTVAILAILTTIQLVH